MTEDIVKQLANEAVQRAKSRTPMDTGGLHRKQTTGSLGIPIWLAELLDRAGWSGYVLAVELGGRGVLHPELGWVSVGELRAAAAERDTDD